MEPLRIHKVIGALPGILEPNAIYIVRVGVGFDLYVTDSTGGIAHKVNDVTGTQVHVGPTAPSDTSMLWVQV